MAQKQPFPASDLSDISESDAASSAAPARGAEMRRNLLGKLRPPPLSYSWDFWHDRQDREPTPSAASTPSTASQQTDSPAKETTSSDEYENRLRKLQSIQNVRDFWEVFNNFDISTLWLRDSIHLFHKGVKPVWEDPRNARGGSWTFRVPKAMAGQFWKEICMMAIGDRLQEAVASNRITFKDDICGVSLSVRTASYLIMIWNRDAEHEQGIQNILKTVIEGLTADLKPREGSYYYKRHSEHAGFKPLQPPQS